MNHLTKIISASVLLFCLTLSTLAQAGTLTSIVNRNQLSLNETFTLQVSYDQPTESDKLDIGGLFENFEVLSVRPQTSSSVSVVNGQRSQTATTIWVISLAPKRRGTLEIPAFEIDNDRSLPITVSVSV